MNSPENRTKGQTAKLTGIEELSTAHHRKGRVKSRMMVKRRWAPHCVEIHQVEKNGQLRC